MQARAAYQVQVLPVALAPAQVPLDEVRQGGRVLLVAALLLRQYADLPPCSPHQDRLDLVMAQDATAERRLSGKRRQAAMLHERRDPDDRVVPPIGPAIPLPPGTADRVGPHA